MIIHNICSRKDILLQELQRGVELLRFKDFFNIYPKNRYKKKLFVFPEAIAKQIKQFVICVMPYKQRRCYLQFWLVFYDLVFFPETITNLGNISEGIKAVSRKLLT